MDMLVGGGINTITLMKSWNMKYKKYKRLWWRVSAEINNGKLARIKKENEQNKNKEDWWWGVGGGN